MEEDTDDGGEFTTDTCGTEGTTDIDEEIGNDIAEISEAVVSTATEKMSSSSSSVGKLAAIGTSGCDPPSRPVTKSSEEEMSLGGFGAKSGPNGFDRSSPSPTKSLIFVESL